MTPSSKLVFGLVLIWFTKNPNGFIKIIRMKMHNADEIPNTWRIPPLHLFRAIANEDIL